MRKYLGFTARSPFLASYILIALCVCGIVVFGLSAQQPALPSPTEGVVIVGQSASVNFPTTIGALSRLFLGGVDDGFVSSINFPTSSNPNGQLRFSTYFGGFGAEQVRDVALDSAGNIYVTGRVESHNLPTTPGVFEPTFRGGTMDAFVAEFGPTGNLIFCTYLGGSVYDVGYSIAVDPAGFIYVSGRTSSANFPVTAGAFQTHYGGGQSSLAPYLGGDFFVVKMKPKGTGLVWGTYVGGSQDDFARGRLFVDAAGAVYVEGGTRSANFPTTPNAAQRVLHGAQDAIVLKLSPNGAQLNYSTYLGGIEKVGELAFGGIAVNSLGQTFVCGLTSAPDFPTTSSVLKRTLSGESDIFIARLGPNGGLISSTLLGGNSPDECDGLALDSSDRPIILGVTSSFNYPTTAGAYDRAFGGGKYDFAVTKLAPALNALVFSTYIGSGGDDVGDTARIDVDPAGNIIFTGNTNSPGFPVTPGAIRSTYGGGTNDAVFVKLAADGSHLIYSTYLGAGADDFARSIRYRPN